MAWWNFFVNFLYSDLPIDFLQLVATGISILVAFFGIIWLPRKQKRKSDRDLLYRYLSALTHQASFCRWLNSEFFVANDSIENCPTMPTGDAFVWDEFYAVRALLFHYKKAEEAGNTVAGVESEYNFRSLVSILEKMNGTISSYQNFISQNANRFENGKFIISGEKKTNVKFKIHEGEFIALKDNVLKLSRKIEKEFDEVIGVLVTFMRAEFSECKDLPSETKPPK